jgi:hypothetical protein
VALGQADVLHHPDPQHTPKPSFAARLRGTLAVLFVLFGLLATAAWIALLGWLLYRAVLTLGFVQ